MTQDEAKAIIEREPIGFTSDFYCKSNKKFYGKTCGKWYVFLGEWVSCEKPKLIIKPMHEILAIALGDEK